MRVARSFIFSRLLYFRLRARPHPPLARPGCTPSPHPDAREQQRSNERPRAPRTLQLALPNHFRARPKFRWNTNLRSSFPASPLVREDRLYEDVEWQYGNMAHPQWWKMRFSFFHIFPYDTIIIVRLLTRIISGEGGGGSLINDKWEAAELIS